MRGGGDFFYSGRRLLKIEQKHETGISHSPQALILIRLWLCSARMPLALALLLAI